MGYIPGNSWLHEKSPGFKFALALALLLFGVAGSLKILLGQCVLLVAVAWVFLRTLHPLALGLRSIRWLLLVAVVFPPWLIPGTPVEIMGTVLPAITQQGIHQGILAGLKLSYILLLSILFISTTQPQTIIDSFRKYRAQSGSNTNVWTEFALIAILAFQAIPVLLLSADDTMANLNKTLRESPRTWREKISLSLETAQDFILKAFQNPDRYNLSLDNKE